MAWSSVGSRPGPRHRRLVVRATSTLDWDDPAFRAFVERLAAHHTVIRYDRPGTGAVRPRGPVPDDAGRASSPSSPALDSRTPTRRRAGWPCSARPRDARSPRRTRRRHPDRGRPAGPLRRRTPAAPTSRRRRPRQPMLSVVEQATGDSVRACSPMSSCPARPPPSVKRSPEFQRRSATPETAAASLRAVYEFDSTAGYLRQVRLSHPGAAPARRPGDPVRARPRGGATMPGAHLRRAGRRATTSPGSATRTRWSRRSSRSSAAGCRSAGVAGREPDRNAATAREREVLALVAQRAYRCADRRAAGAQRAHRAPARREHPDEARRQLARRGRGLGHRARARSEPAGYSPSPATPTRWCPAACW